MTSSDDVDTSPRLSVTEYAVLGLLAESPRHGFAIAKELESDTEVGRVLTVRRPLVYRALDRLAEAEYTEPVTTEKGEGPTRVIHRATASGRRRLRRWLQEPVEHVRDLRIEFLLKLALMRRAGLSPLGLIESQRAILDPMLSSLDETPADPADHVGLWRRHIAAATDTYLEDLERLHRPDESPSRGV